MKELNDLLRRAEGPCNLLINGMQCKDTSPLLTIIPRLFMDSFCLKNLKIWLSPSSVEASFRDKYTGKMGKDVVDLQFSVYPDSTVNDGENEELIFFRHSLFSNFWTEFSNIWTAEKSLHYLQKNLNIFFCC